MAKVKRKPTGVRRSAAARSRTQKARAAKKHTSGLLDRAMAALPFTEEQWHKFFLFLIVAAGLGIAWTVASYAGVPEMARTEIAKSASRAGFEVERVRVTGVERLNRQAVYERVLGEQDRPMPLVEVDEIRERLLELSWVKDARVSRQLPDLLRIDIVEREPHAVVRKPDRLILVDATGHELEPVSSEQAKGMLLISGPGAQKQVAELNRLLDAAPALKPQIAGAEWVGNRRWNLTFKTDQLLALPEGDKGPAALVKFAEMDGRNRLIGGKAIAIDMRVPDRAYLRCADGPCPQGMSAQVEAE
ncbi:FtsQ-type POTRA domain-containing protein [Qipengyuania sp. 1XM1-15A]|uniref:cell division protein FtsQ/DivIB n=1 Tax=Qipengyuania xiamenensis TaxID=2867237 RepID=UPI001C88AEBF|nr:FtsQ-type POTRA domain-containing protein [Qipengyuania xiamenensis]MBX7533228.1 FtsQ-type POTRA domain-containing protein [Qipengyuania xiamenensis]